MSKSTLRSPALWRQALEATQVPFDDIPPTVGGRRKLIELLASPFLGSATGYICVAEVWRAPDEGSVNPTEHPDREEGVLLQAETRAGDRRTRMYRIMRQTDGPPTLELAEQSRESPPGLFSSLLDVADATPERRCVDEGLLQTALAAHAETIDTLGDDDMLMFAVGEDLMQVIGAEHAVRECTMLRLANIKAKAAAGDRQAQRWYYELTAGRGVVIRIQRGADGRETGKMKFPSEEGWFAEVEPGLNFVSLVREDEPPSSP